MDAINSKIKTNSVDAKKSCFINVGYEWHHTGADISLHSYDSKAIIHCSYSLLLRAKLRRNKYKMHSVWFDPTGLKHTIYRTQGEHDNHYTPTICI
jgi:hypothetical protein